MGPIPVAAIGCGEITQLMHLRFIDEIPDLQLVALCDLARSHNFGGNSQRYKALFNIVRPKPDEHLTDNAGDIINAATSKLLEEAVGPDPKLQRLYWSLLMGATHDEVGASNESPFRREWDHFVECIRTGSRARTSIEAGLFDIETIHELVQSAKR